jgi:gliding motility-associated-like protein
MTIFDRWGTEVFFTNDLNIGWDGMFNGKKAQEEIYNWEIFYEGEGQGNYGMKKHMIGRVALIR